MPMETGNFEMKTHPNDFVLRRTLKAPRKLVFECFTKPEHVTHFWAPKPFVTLNCKMDLRPGGKWTYTFRSPEGLEHNAEHVYREIHPPQKLVMEAGVPGPDGKPFFTIRQTILLEERGKETDLTLEVKVLEANPGSEPFLGGAKQGTGMTIDNLEEYLGQLQSKKG